MLAYHPDSDANQVLNTSGSRGRGVVCETPPADSVDSLPQRFAVLRRLADHPQFSLTETGVAPVRPRDLKLDRRERA